jgi:alpha-tubulin suppressor-like RCC1 family protein
MGYSFKGRLGCVLIEECEKKICITLPREVRELRGIQIVQIAVGNYCSFAVSSKGKLYGWGENKNFILGKLNNQDDDTNKKSQILYSPFELPINRQLIVINLLILESWRGN